MPRCQAVAASLEGAGAKLFTFTRVPKSQRKSIRTSHAIVVREAHHEGLHEEFKRRIKTQTVLPPELVEGAESAAMLFWALLASGQITMRKVDGCRSRNERPSDQIIDLAASSGNFVLMEIAPKQIPTTSATAPAAGNRSPQWRDLGRAPRQSNKMRLMTPLSSWQGTCRLPPVWAKSGFAFK